MYNNEIINNKESAKTIIDLYIKEHKSIDELSQILHMGALRITNILKANNIPFRHRSNAFPEKYPKIEGKHYIAIDKETGIIYNDYLNKSGILTRIIENKGISVPTTSQRAKYFFETNDYWYEQWFLIQLVDDNPVKKCPYCEWSTKDISNNSGAFGMHLEKIHNISKNEYLKEHPEDFDYFLVANNTKNLQLENNPDKFITCPICSKRLRWINSKHLEKHGITKLQYVNTYGVNRLSNLTKDKLIASANNMNLSLDSKENKFSSLPEKSIKSYIDSLGFSTTKDRRILNGEEIDIYVPSEKIGFEFNGNKWHTEWFGHKGRYYHLNKTLNCEAKGIDLIHIFEDEFYEKRDIVYSKIRHLLKADSNLPKIGGRKCIVKKIEKVEGNTFLDKYHIQGSSNSTLFYGAYFQNKLIAVMSFLRENKSGKWNLTRFASDYNYICQGIGGKLFSTFVKENSPKIVKSFADRRWTVTSQNNVYVKLGFTLDKILKPDYRYYNPHIDRYKRFHKFGFRKQILSKKYGFPLSMTETEMVRELGYDRIWDCGLLKYVWKNTK